MVRRITASYTNYLEYVVPKNLPLLSVDENEAVTEENVPFSWWVKWSTFYYYDKNGKMQELPLDSESTGAKRPSDFEDEDDGEEYEEDSNCPLCKKDCEDVTTDMNRCKTCDTNIGCTDCTQCYDKKETNYCDEHEDDYESDDEHQECQDCNVKNEFVKYHEKRNKVICHDCAGWADPDNEEEADDGHQTSDSEGDSESE